jgi:hypothetical protein
MDGSNRQIGWLLVPLPDFAWAQGQPDCTPSVRFALWRRIAAAGAAPRDESSARQCFMPEFADVSLWSSVLST